MNYEDAMKARTQSEADLIFERLVQECLDRSKDPISRECAEGIQRHNIGYYAGYYDDQTRSRVERLFRCSHPVFGAIQDKKPPTPEQAFEMGVKFAKRRLPRRKDRCIS